MDPAQAPAMANQQPGQHPLVFTRDSGQHARTVVSPVGGLIMWRGMCAGVMCLLAASVGAGLAAAGEPAKTTDPYKGMQPMRIVIARDLGPGCEPTCAEWISAEGDIVPGTAKVLHRLLKRLGKRKLPLFISSPGGSIEAALAMGREIRARGLDVAVVRTYFAACEPGSKTCKNGAPRDGAGARADSSQAFCASSCTFVLASGTRRVAPAVSHVGVHQITAFQTFVRVKRVYRVLRQIRNGVAVEVSRRLISEKPVSRKTVEAEITDKSYKPILAFFKDMGITDDIVPLMVSAPNSDIHWMTREELAATKLTTDEMDGEVLLYEPTIGAAASGTVATLEGGEFNGAAKVAVSGRAELGIDLGLSYIKPAQNVSIRMTILENARPIATRDMSGAFKVALSSAAKAMNTVATAPAAPLAAEIPVADFCILTTLPFARIALDWTSGPRQNQHADAELDVRRAGSLAAFVGKVCGGRG